jgi:hypothetical protein
MLRLANGQRFCCWSQSLRFSGIQSSNPLTEKEPMKTHHWITIVAVFVVAYIIGVKFPNVGKATLAKLGM